MFRHANDKAGSDLYRLDALGSAAAADERESAARAAVSSVPTRGADCTNRRQANAT